MSVNQVFMDSREYTQEELEKLHEELYGILAEIVRRYRAFVIGDFSKWVSYNKGLQAT